MKSLLFVQQIFWAFTKCQTLFKALRRQQCTKLKQLLLSWCLNSNEGRHKQKLINWTVCPKEKKESDKEDRVEENEGADSEMAMSLVHSGKAGEAGGQRNGEGGGSWGRRRWLVCECVCVSSRSRTYDPVLRFRRGLWALRHLPLVRWDTSGGFWAGERHDRRHGQNSPEFLAAYHKTLTCLSKQAY